MMLEEEGGGGVRKYRVMLQRVRGRYFFFGGGLGWGGTYVTCIIHLPFIHPIHPSIQLTTHSFPSSHPHAHTQIIYIHTALTLNPPTPLFPSIPTHNHIFL